MNTFENKEIINPFELKLQSLSDNITGNFRTIEFSQNLNSEKTKELNNIFAQFLSPQNQLETV
ncbi:MAG: hypothetical protein PHG82_00810 [Candidatus Gracilibacteria bacterium]|nr:hypothetical protein [Candidatus Gracilibacteria bacterium]